LISECLFGGLPFVETDEFDEEPGLRLERDVLMLHVCVVGETPHFGLTFRTKATFFARQPTWPKVEDVDLSSYVEAALASLDQIQIVPT
jgi:hypothetical protein